MMSDKEDIFEAEFLDRMLAQLEHPEQIFASLLRNGKRIMCRLTEMSEKEGIETIRYLIKNRIVPLRIMTSENE